MRDEYANYKTWGYCDCCRKRIFYAHLPFLEDTGKESTKTVYSIEWNDSWLSHEVHSKEVAILICIASDDCQERVLKQQIARDEDTAHHANYSYQDVVEAQERLPCLRAKLKELLLAKLPQAKTC